MFRNFGQQIVIYVYLRMIKKPIDNYIQNSKEYKRYLKRKLHVKKKISKMRTFNNKQNQTLN